MKLFGLLGFPLSHSFSPSYFSNKFLEEHTDAEYHLFEYDVIQEGISELRKLEQLQGFNITIPYKEKIIEYLDDISESAQKIGAVNTVLVTENKWIGYNTDYIGFIETLRPLLKPDSKRAIVLGTGGASKAVLYGLGELGIQHTSVSRDKKKGDISYEELTSEVISMNDIIINTTPLGVYPKVGLYPNIPYHSIRPNSIMIDLIYNPKQTIFLKKGLAQGANIENGLNMLYIQAEKSWNIWTQK